MSSTALHLKVQRSRFSHHLIAAFAGLLPASWVGRTAVDQPADAAREAAAVRELAQRYVKTDPGFAEDLYAAANRHEGQNAV